MQPVGQSVEFVHRADGDRVAELRRDLGECATPESVAVALDDGHESVDGVRDAGRSALATARCERSA